MNDTRKFYLKLLTFTVILNLVLLLFGAGKHWRLTIWVIAAVALVFSVLPVLGSPFHWIYQGYRAVTTESMRFLQGAGIALALIGTYLAIYFPADPQSLFEAFRSLLSQMGFSSGVWVYWWIAGLLLFVIGLIPPAAKALYGLWMKFAELLHAVVSRIVLTLAFLITVIPVGFLAKLMGKRFLDTHINRDAESYWKDIPDTPFNPEKYKKQF